jgi:hypothetical protein
VARDHRATAGDPPTGTVITAPEPDAATVSGDDIDPADELDEEIV